MNHTAHDPSRPQRPRKRRLRRAWQLSVVLIGCYAILAYLALPLFWTHYEHQSKLADMPMVTRTAQGIPGDPINVGLIGDQHEIVCAILAANWHPADPITLRSSIAIAGSVLLDRPYPDAPVSSLYYLDRREDLAFEKPDGRSADRRNHVRLWKVLDSGQEGRPVWLGSATFDRGVGVSHYTGAVTHHIAPDIDAERDQFAADLEAAAMVDAKYQITGVGPTIAGRNGEGDLYYTDGEVWILRLTEGCKKRSSPAEILPSPLATEIKDQIFRTVTNAIEPGASAP
ncbi:conserved hypothetical protein [Rhodopseudomonas palustris TIE-1]|uniref:LssY C-terminal domain-containing protein n=1 Tax=Rhodopseudomonas palustris TaxID=1076 RepID=UPI000164ACB1|nr:LssY C-terminal domain-containing protein [Rhodopseudomonas palustris]ACE99415.1 conserved hypothetical protein [Rhodopseudomonas palustris TIE-1]QLH69983.1 LssY C-terminal domain-containing protein [Rhodopseudomonas palustris]RIA01858.1 hypothetical protein D1920_10770 [Rhodopseudomonas palustris]